MKVVLLFLTLTLVSVGYSATGYYYDQCTVEEGCVVGDKGHNCKFDFVQCKQDCVKLGKALNEHCTDDEECQLFDGRSECRLAAVAATLKTCECIMPLMQVGMACPNITCTIGMTCDSTVPDYYEYHDSPHHFCNGSSMCGCEDGYVAGNDGASCVVDNKLVGDSCTFNENCPNHYTKTGAYDDVGTCSSGVCVCDNGFAANSDNNKCTLKKALVDAACDIDKNCPDHYDKTGTPSLDIGTCTAGLCVCDNGYVKNAGKDKCVLTTVLVSGACLIPENCPGHYNTPSDASPTVGTCNGTMYCDCNSGWDANAGKDKCIYIMATVGGACEVDGNCPSNYGKGGTPLNSAGTCSSNVCVCDTSHGYTAPLAATKCILTADLVGQTCVDDHNCPDYFRRDGTTYVHYGNCNTSLICQCDSGFVATSGNSKCVADALMVGQTCFGDDEPCPYHYKKDATTFMDLGTCNATSLCQCDPGFTASANLFKCVADTKLVTDACTINENCPYHYDVESGASVSGGTCSTTCVCNSGYKANSGNTKCILDTVPKITYSCSINKQCLVHSSPTSAGGYCQAGTCVCDIGYKSTDLLTQCVIDDKELHQECLIDLQCSDMTPNSECALGEFDLADTPCSVCVCSPGYARVGWECEAVEKMLHQFCHVDANCDCGQACIDDYCQCASGYILASDSKSCEVDMVNIGESCTLSAQCPSAPFSWCVSGHCTCGTGSKASDGSASCVSNRQPVGGVCSMDSDCLNRAMCTAGKCSCAPWVLNANTSMCEPQKVGMPCVNPMLMCSPDATCVEGVCQCNHNYAKTRNGYCGRMIGAHCDMSDHCSHIMFAACGPTEKPRQTCLCANGTTLITSPTAVEDSCSGAERLFAICMPLMLLLALFALLH